MSFLKSVLLLLAAIPMINSPVKAAVIIDFNSMTDLTDDFTGIPWAANSMLSDNIGLNGSKGIKYENSIVGAASDLRIYTPVPLSPFTPFWEISIAFKGDNFLSHGLPMIGILGKDSRYLSDLRYPNGFATPDSSTPTIYTKVSNGSLSLYGSNGSYLSSISVPSVFDSSWHILTLEVTYLGTISSVINEYDIRASLFKSDEFGQRVTQLAQIDDSLSTVQFQGVDELYGFFGIDTPNYYSWAGPGFTGVIDNFSIVPEPTSVALILLCCLVLIVRYLIQKIEANRPMHLIPTRCHARCLVATLPASAAPALRDR